MSKREFIENGVLEVGKLVSCGHPHRGVEAHAACRLARCDGAASRLGRPPAVGAQPVQVKGHGTLFTATPTRDFQLRLPLPLSGGEGSRPYSTARAGATQHIYLRSE